MVALLLPSGRASPDPGQHRSHRTLSEELYSRPGPQGRGVWSLTGGIEGAGRAQALTLLARKCRLSPEGNPHTGLPHPGPALPETG